MIKSVIFVPAFLAIFMGMVSDVFPIRKSRRKNYLIFLSVLDIVNYTALYFLIEYRCNWTIIVMCSFLSSMFNAWRITICCKLIRWFDD